MEAGFSGGGAGGDSVMNGANARLLMMGNHHEAHSLIFGAVTPDLLNPEYLQEKLMSNHGDRLDEMGDEFRKLFEANKDFLAGEKEALLKQHLNDNLGATGKYPEGKLRDRDEGEIAFAVGAEQGKVVLNFGKPVAWIGFTPEQAMEIARLIRNKAKRMLRSEFAG